MEETINILRDSGFVVLGPDDSGNFTVWDDVLLYRKEYTLAELTDLANQFKDDVEE